jgi:hypothetical protein
MPVDPLSEYVNQVEAAFRNLPSGYIERYEEEWLTPKRVNLRIRVRFPKGEMLEWNEAVIVEEGDVEHLAYRYHFQAKDNKVIFRYDNTPHFQGFNTFPHHKHLMDNVLPARRPSVLKVLDEVNETLES